MVWEQDSLDPLNSMTQNKQQTRIDSSVSYILKRPYSRLRLTPPTLARLPASTAWLRSKRIPRQSPGYLPTWASCRSSPSYSWIETGGNRRIVEEGHVLAPLQTPHLSLWRTFSYLVSGRESWTTPGLSLSQASRARLCSSLSSLRDFLLCSEFEPLAVEALSGQQSRNFLESICDRTLPAT